MACLKKHPKPSNDFECKGTAFFTDMQIKVWEFKNA